MAYWKPAQQPVDAIGRTFRNPFWSEIAGMLGQFSDEYKSTWTSLFPAGGQVDESLNGILRVKNALAHKGTMHLHVTLGDVQKYYHDVLPAVDELERIIAGIA